MAALAIAALLVSVPTLPAAATPSGSVSTAGTVTTSPSNSTLGHTTGGSGVNRTTTDGDTLSWASSLSNGGSLQAQGTVTDVFDSPASSPIPHIFQGGSLEVPPAFTPQWSTDAGTTWLNSEPATPSTVNAVRSSGLLAPGPSPGAAFPVLPILAALQLPSGVDGWDVSFYGANVYVTPHHTGGRIYCFVKASGAVCPGSPYALGVQFNSSGVSGPAIDRNAGILWEAGYSSATQRAQLQCFNLVSNTPCATNAIDFGPPITGFNPLNVVSETTLVNGKVYFLYLGQNVGPTPDSNRTNVLACWDPTLGASGAYCTGTGPNGLFTLNLGSWQAGPADGSASASAYHTAVWLQNGRLYLQNQALRVTCWDPSTDTSCPGPWPVDLSQFGLPGEQFGLVPRVAGGVENGFCAVRRAGTSATVACINGAGNSVTAPVNLDAMFEPPITPASPATPIIAWHAAVAFGSRVYLPRHPAITIPCFDYATDSSCAGFAPVSLNRAYTVRADPYFPECIWANSDVGTVVAFDAYTGGACGKDQRFTVRPQDYYCSGAAAVTRYGTLSLSGLAAGAFTTATVGVADANGNPITGYTNVTLTPANPSVSLSGIPYGSAVVIGGNTYDTTVLNVLLTFAGTVQSNASWVSSPPPTLNVTWDGPPIQPLCFRTVVPPELCAVSATGAVAVVTTATLQDTTGTTNLGPFTASFDYQPAGSCPGGGTLKVCKVAGPGVAVGTTYTFSAGPSTFTVPAGPPPGGTCVVAPQSFPVGAIVNVKETIPPGDTVVAIQVAPPAQQVGMRDLATGSVDVRIGDGVTQVTYTDKRTGFVEICKQREGAGVTGSFSFFLDPGGVGPVVVPAGGCSPSMEMPAGPVVITETLGATTHLVNCYTIPAARQGSCDTSAQTSTVTVAPGDISAETIAFLVNRRIHTTTEGDYNGDSKADVAVFRPSNNTWYVRDGATVAFGAAGDIPVPCDYNGDGTTDIAVFRPAVGAWFIFNQPTVSLGVNGDMPVPADYDGDGDCDPGVFRPSVGGWYRVGAPPVFHGLSGDIPVPADYDGDGSADITVFRPSVGGWYRNNAATTFHGLSGDIPVPADYDGNGAAEVGVFRPSVGGWYVIDQTTQFIGLAGDIPVPADYDGNGAAERAVFRPRSGAWHIGDQPAIYFGLQGDRPLPLPSAVRQALFP